MQLREVGKERLPPWISRAILTLLIGIAILWYMRGVVTALRPLIIMLLVSLFLSFALEPAVNQLERIGLRRGIGTALVFLLAIAALGGFGFQVGTLLADQVSEFNNNVPTYMTKIDEFLEKNLGIKDATADLRNRYSTGSLATKLGDLSRRMAQFGTTVANVLFQLFTIGLFTFYLVAEGPKVRRLICSFLIPHRQRQVVTIWDLAVKKTGGYILSRALLAVISAGIHWGAFELIGLPSSLALALWVGVISQFVPVIGTYIAGALPLLVGLISGEPVDGLWVLLIVVVYQQIENYLLSPRITAHTMQIHAAVAFGSVIAGAAILGIVGALLAIPAAATTQAVIASATQRHDVDDDLVTKRNPNKKQWLKYKQEDSEKNSPTEINTEEEPENSSD